MSATSARAARREREAAAALGTKRVGLGPAVRLITEEIFGSG
jgi:hypothetical protein